MKLNSKDLLLYAVTDRYWLKENESLIDVTEKAIKGGATFIQLREKDLPKDKILEEAYALRKLCSKYSIPFVLDDDVDIAKKVNADGVHVGQSDMAAKYAREILGDSAIIGVSAQTVEQAIKAEKDGADYLGVGAVFPTSSKDDAEDVDHETLKKICESVSIPVIAIGGINKENIEKLSNTGICGIAVISAIFAEKDIEKATLNLRDKTLEMINNNKQIL